MGAGKSRGYNMTPNATQKRIIKALAASPAAALRELIRKSNDAEEIAYIKRVAEAIGINLTEDKTK